MKKFLLIAALSFTLFSTAQVTSAQLKTQIDTDITNKTGWGSISKTNVGNNMKAVVDYAAQTGRPYKVYSVIINQAQTGDPVITVMENTIGTITVARTGAGVYTFTRTGAFTNNKTLLSPAQVCINSYSGNSYNASAFRTSADVVTLSTTLGTVATDGVLSSFTFEIRVYN